MRKRLSKITSKVIGGRANIGNNRTKAESSFMLFKFPNASSLGAFIRYNIFLFVDTKCQGRIYINNNLEWINLCSKLFHWILKYVH